MKKPLLIIFFSFLLHTGSFAGPDGKGQVQLSEDTIYSFMEYLRGGIGTSTSLQNRPETFWITIDGTGSYRWYCPYGGCRSGDVGKQRRACENAYNKECARFARSRTVRWDNGTNPGGKAARFSSKMELNEIKSKLNSLGFYNNDFQKSEVKTKTNKVLTPKTTKKYQAKGERSIALSWEGYDDLIAGKINFNEKDYKGTLSLSLPNNDGECEGSYILQTNGTGTWQLSCSNNMGAAGTLKWIPDKSVTGIGRDYNDKKVKFTVSGKG